MQDLIEKHLAALDRAPADEASFREVENLLAHASRWEELLKLYEQRAKQFPDAPAAPHLWARAGDLVRTRLNNFERAEELYRRALVGRHDEPAALQGLQVIYESKGNLFALADLLDRRARATAGADAAAVWLACGGVEENLGRRERAVLAYQRALRVDPGCRDAYLKAFEALVALKRWALALHVAEALRDRVGPTGIVDLLVPFAEQLQDAPHEHALALRALDAALALDPAHARARSLQAALQAYREAWPERVRALWLSANQERDPKRLAGLYLAIGTTHTAFDTADDGRAKGREFVDRALTLWPGMPGALDALERAAAATGDWASLAKSLEKLQTEAHDRGALVEILLRLAMVRVVRLNDRAGAMTALIKAAQVDASRAEAVSLAVEFLLDEGRPQEATAMLERHLATLDDPRAQVGLRLRLAELLETRFSQRGEAKAHLEAALSSDPTCLEAALRLVSLYDAAGEGEKLAQTLEIVVQAEADHDRRLAGLLRLGELYGERLARPGDATRAFARALLLEPQSPEIRQAMEKNAAAAGAWGEAVRALRLAAEVAKPNAGVALLRRAAGIADQALGNLDEAQRLWKRVLELAPGDAQAASAVESLLARGGAHEELLRGYEKQLAAATSQKERRDVLAKMARAFEHAGADPSRAAGVYRSILEIAPDDAETLKRFGAACAALENWDEVAAVAGKLASLASSPDEAREWRARRAQVLAERIGRKEEAAEILLGIFADEPSRPGVAAALERIAASGVRSRRIAESLLPLHLEAGEHGKASQALQTLIAGAEDPARRVAFISQLARLLEEKLADRRSAFGWLEQGMRLAPSDRTVRAELERLAGSLSAQAEIAALYLEVADTLSDVAVKLELTLQAGLLAEAGGEADLSVQALDRAMALPGGSLAAAKALQRVAAHAERWPECERALTARLAHEAENGALWVDLAKVHDRLGRTAEAAADLEKGIAAGASEVELLPHLARLYESAHDADGLERALTRALDLAEKAGDRDRAARLRLRISKLQERFVGDRSKAVANYAAVLAERPSDPEALGALEKMLQTPELREAAARALAPAYEASKEHRKLVFALEVLCETAEQPADKVAILKRIAHIHTVDLRHPPLAFATLARALRVTPTDPQLRVATRRVAEESESLDTYAEILAEVAASVPGAQAVPLFRDLAEVWERKLGDREQAIGHLQRLLELEPDNIDGLRGLHRLLRLSERWAELAPICRRLAQVIYDDQERKTLYREAGTLFERAIKLPEEAAACFRALAEAEPLDRDAALALERLNTALKRPHDLAFALELRRAQEGKNAAGREAAYRLAEIKRGVLGDPLGALQIYGQILAEEPTHASARAALEAWAKSGSPGSAEATALIDPALARAGEHARRVALREAAFAQATVPEKARLSAEIRAIYERDMGRTDLAFMSACRVFTEGVDREKVSRELERLARETGSWEELADVYEAVAEQTRTGDEIGTVCLRRAAQLRAQLGESERAVGLWKDLLGEIPGDREALEALAKLHERSQNARELAEVYRQQALLAQDLPSRAGLLLQAGLAKMQAGDDASAVELGRAALVLTPGNRAALELLDRAYERLGRGREHADVLELLAQATQDAPIRRAVSMRRAQILEREGEPALAVEAYAEVLAESAGEAAAVAGLERLFQNEQARPLAARAIEPFYRSIEDGRHLADVLEVRVGQSSKEERHALLLEIARLRESMGQKPMAFTALLRAFRDDPHDTAVREELERLAAETGAFDDLAAAYEDELDQEKDEAIQATLWRRLGAIYADRLGLPDRAAQAWEEVYRRDPGDPAVLETLSRIYRRTSSLRELVAVLWRQVALCGEPARKREHLVEVAQICEQQLDDRESAVAAWREIRKLNEDDAQALAALPRLLQECGRYDELSELLGWRAARAQTQGKIEESLELLVALGRIRLTRLADPRGALAILQDVVAKRPGHAGAVAVLEEMARGEGGLKAEAAMALEPVFAQGGDFLRLVQMLDARSQGAQPLEKAALLRRVAELYAGPLASVEMAFVYAKRALEAAPDDADSLAAVLKHAEAAGAQEECVVVLSEIVEKARTDPARGAVQRALARVLASGVGEPALAIDAYKRLLEFAPGDVEALDGLVKLYEANGQWQELLEVLRRQLAASNDTSARAHLLCRMGEVQDERLGDRAGAIATLRRLLEVAPDDREGLQRLDRLCQGEERWAELADVLDREIALARKEGTAEQVLTLTFRLAQVREQRLVDRVGAVALYREVLEARPAHPETVARLEALVAKDPGFEEAADLLAQTYRTLSDHSKLAKLLEDRVSGGGDLSARKRFWGELARIRTEQQERPDLAFISLCKAFREDPSDTELRKELERAADQAETHEELAGLYEEELPQLSGPSAAQVCLKLAQLNEQRIHDTDLAISFYEKARAFDPSVSRAALPALDRLYKDARDWPRLGEVLAALAALTEDTAERVALLFRLGQLAEERLDPPSPDRAARAYEQVLEIDPGHLPAARALERLYGAAQQPERLFEVLALQQQHAIGPEKERITARMAEVAASGLKDADRAIALYGDVLALNSRSDAAFLALETLYEQTQQTEALVELLRRRLSITVDPREITRVSDKLGRVLAGVGRHEEAIGAFRAALERDPRHRPALESLRDIYEQYAPSEDLAAVLRRLVLLQDDVDSVKKVRLRLAEVLAELGRREEAVEAARRILDVEPHRADDLMRAEALFRSLEAFSDQIRAMEPRAELARAEGDLSGATGVLYAIAEVYVNALQKRDAAAPTYERILEMVPGERLAFDALREIYAALGDWRKYASACERFLPGAASDQERVEILKDLGSVQEQRLGHKDLAFLSCCRAFSAAPADEEVRQAMHRLAEDTGSFEELATVYEEIVDTVPKGPLAEKLYLALARLHDEKLDQPDQAESALRKVLEFDSGNRAALEALSQMFARRGKDAEYVVSLEHKYEAASSIEERKAILRELAQTFDARLRKPDEAASAYLRSLELDPDAETYRTLADLYRRDKRWQEVAEVLLRLRDFETEPEVRGRVQVEVADLYEREIQDDEAAVAGYQLALELDGGNRDALAALERLYTKLDRAAELLGVYDAQLKMSEDTRDRVKILFKTAGIWEDKYQNLENADACLEAVLALEPANLQAIKGLERLRRLDAEKKRPSSTRWEDLLRAYEQHLALGPDVAEQVELLVAAGNVYYKELKRIDRAAQIFHHALELNPHSLEAMHELGLLYERSGNWPFALEMLEREAGLLGSSKEAVELLHRIGKINEEMLLDAGGAKRAYQKALALDAGYLPSVRSLKGLFEAEKDWDSYLQIIVQEATYTVDPEERAHAWISVAHFYQDSREDRDNAARYYEEALKLVPDSLEAARPLADIFEAREEWERAERMLDVVAKGLAESAARDPQVGLELCRQMYRLGYVCEKLKKGERALAAYERAYQLDSTYLPSAEGYANLLVAAGRSSDALSVYQAILIHHREDLTDLEVVEYYWQVGDLYRKLGSLERAKKEFDKALAIDSNHEPSIRSEIDLSEALEDWEGAIGLRRRLAAVSDEGRFELFVAIGQCAGEKLKDPYRAADAYVTALELQPDSPEVLEALLPLYRETRQASRAVEVAEKLLALPQVRADAVRSRKLWFTAGEIWRDELKDVGRAADAFNQALDCDFRFIKAFSALEAMLGQARQWDALEANYKRMIQRLPKIEETHAARMTLWRTLGDFYEKVKKDRRATKTAYQVVVAGLPQDTAALEKYAEVASEEEGSEREAIDAWRKALPATEHPERALSNLVRLFAKAKDYDGAYMAAQVTAHLISEAGADEREILTKLAPYARRREQASRPMTAEMWTSWVCHPKVKKPVADILALLYEKLGAVYAKKPSAFGVDPRTDRIDLASSLELAVQTYRYIATTLDMEALALYSPFLVSTRERIKQKGAGLTAPPDKDLLLEVLPTHPVSIKAGGRLFGEQPQKELYFFLAKTMTFARPQFAFARLLPLEKLDAVFQAAVLAGVPSFRATADPKAVDAEMRIIERLDPETKAILARLGREYTRGAGPSDIRDFVEGAELTANRVGALLAGDMEAVRGAMAKDPGAAAKLPMRVRARDLMNFLVSKDHAEARSALGMKIEIKLPAAR